MEFKEENNLLSSPVDSRRLKIEANERFRAALVSHGEFRYGSTLVAESGFVSVRQGRAEDSVLQVLNVRVEGEGITPAAFRGLRVVPVDDESINQPTQTMGKSGEVNFSLTVHSVRFEQP